MWWCVFGYVKDGGVYATKTQRRMEVLLHSVSTLALDEEEWSMSCSCHLTTRKEPRYQLNMKFGASQVQYGYVCRWEKSLSRIWIPVCSPVPYQLHYPGPCMYMVPINFKDSSTLIFMGKLTLESEEVTVLQNSGNYTTTSIVSHPKGPKFLPMPLWKPQISPLPILPKFYRNCLLNTLEVKCQILLTFNTHTQYMKIQVFWDLMQHRLLNLTFLTSLWVHHILHKNPAQQFNVKIQKL